MRRVVQKRLYKEFKRKYGRPPCRASFGIAKGQPLGWLKRTLGHFVKPEQHSQDEMRYLRNQYRKSRRPSLSPKHREEIRKTACKFRKRLLTRKSKHHARS